MQLQHIDVWQGMHKGVPCEIKSRQQPDFMSKPRTTLPYYKARTAWTYYIRLSKEDFAEGQNESALAGIPFHNGITFLERNENGIKVGCDYNHTCENDVVYTLHDIVHDVERTIDALLEKFPRA